MNGNLKKIILILMILWSWTIAYSQESTSSHMLGPKLLVDFLEQNDWQQINHKLKAKGWTFEEIRGNRIIWAYDKNNYTDRATAWCSAYFENEKNELITYVTDEDIFRKLEKWFPTNGYKKIKTSLKDESIVASYTNSKYIFELQEKSQNQKAEDNNQFIISVIRHGGIYDTLNGYRKIKFDDGMVHYNLSQGVINGEVKVYEYDNLILTGSFKNGEKNGTWQKYDHDGKVTEKVVYKATGNSKAKKYDIATALKTDGYHNGEYEKNDYKGILKGKYINNLRVGQWTLSENGVLRWTKDYNSDGKTFYSKYYDVDGNLSLEGNGEDAIEERPYGEEEIVICKGTWKVYRNGKIYGERTYLNGYSEFTFKDTSDNEYIRKIENILPSYNDNVPSVVSYKSESGMGGPGGMHSIYDSTAYFRNGVKVYERIYDWVQGVYDENETYYFLDGETPYLEINHLSYDENDETAGKNQIFVYDKSNYLISNVQSDNTKKHPFKAKQFNKGTLVQETSFDGNRYKVSFYENESLAHSGTFIPSSNNDENSPSLKFLKSIPYDRLRNIKAVKDGLWTYHKNNIYETYDNGTLLAYKMDNCQIDFFANGQFKSYQEKSFKLTPKMMELYHSGKSKMTYLSKSNITEAKVDDILGRNGNEYYTLDKSFIDALKTKFMNSDITYTWYETEGRVIRKGSMSGGKDSGIETRYDLSANLEMHIDHSTGAQTFTLSNGDSANGIFTLTDIKNTTTETIEIKNGLRHGTTIYYENGVETRKEKYRRGELK